MNKQKQEYKLNKKQSQPEPIVIQLAPEPTPIPEIVIPDINYRTCKDCKESKLLETSFYKCGTVSKHFSHRCKQCQRLFDKDRSRIYNENRGVGEDYRKFPGEYINDNQRQKTYQIMEALGWELDIPTGIWIKPPFKVIKEGKAFFPDILPNKIGRPKKNPQIKHYTIGKKLLENIDELLKHKEEGKTHKQIGSIYSVSNTTIKNVFRKYNEAQKIK